MFSYFVFHSFVVSVCHFIIRNNDFHAAIPTRCRVLLLVWQMSNCFCPTNNFICLVDKFITNERLSFNVTCCSIIIMALNHSPNVCYLWVCSKKMLPINLPLVSMRRLIKCWTKDRTRDHCTIEGKDVRAKMPRVFSLGPRQHPNNSFVSGKLPGPSAWQAGGSDICHKMSSFSKNQMNWDVNMKNEFQLLVFWILNSHWKKIGVWTKLNSSKENACNDWKSCWK